MTQASASFAPPAYEATTNGKHFHSPSDIVPVHEGEPHTTQRNWNVTAISEDVAKEAFAQYAASRCCYSKNPAKEMVICDAQSFNTYRYRLETFAESRSCKWKTEPYQGEPVDPNLRAQAPYPWDVLVEVSPMFKDQIKKVRVPCTSSVKTCGRCRGRGRTSCGSCGGSGRVTCSFGENQSTSTCSSCGGTGKQRCSKCSGKGKLLTYLQLKIKWENHIFEYVIDHGFGFPIKHFDKVYGQEMLFEEQCMVSPVMDFSENTINQVSQRAIEEHRAQFISPIPGQVYPDHGMATWNAIEHPKAEFPPTMCIRRQTYAFPLWGNKHIQAFFLAAPNPLLLDPKGMDVTL